MFVSHRQTCCRPQLCVIFFPQEDFSNNKNITRDNRHPSVLLFFTQENIGCNEITIKDNREGVCFLRLIFQKASAKFFEEMIVIRNYCLKLF